MLLPTLTYVEHLRNSVACLFSIRPSVLVCYSLEIQKSVHLEININVL